MNKRLLTVAETAELTGYHPFTIRKHIRTGKLPAEMFGNTYAIKREDVYKTYNILPRPPVMTIGPIMRLWPKYATPTGTRRYQTVTGQMVQYYV